MSDPNAPNGPIGDDARDPVDRAYAEAEAMLRDDAERAARRTRVLAALAAAQAASEPEAEPAPVASSLPPPRRIARKPAPWLMAAGVAGVATLVGLRVAPVFRPPQIVPAPAPSTPDAGAVREATPPPTTTTPPTTTAPPPAPRVETAQPLPKRSVASRAPAAAALEAPPPLPIPPVQLRVETPPPPPPPPPPAASRSAATAPPPLPIPPVARRLEAPAPAAAMAIGPAYGEMPRPFIITKPDWARRPTGDDIAQDYPARAERLQLSGSATLSCTVTATGLLRECAVISETPAGYSFGEAALRLSRIFRMKPKTADGTSTEGGVVRVPIEFKLPT